MKCLLVLLTTLCAATPALRAQSLLLVVKETLNGSPVAAPMPTGDGLAAALFDAGFIVFDVPDGAVAPGSLLKTASTAGADYVLELSVDFTGTGAVATRIDAHAAFVLRSAPGGSIVLQGSLDGTNRSRESTVDRPALGREMGELVAGKVRDRLSVASP